MYTSTARILTTHAGSIPRGDPFGQMLIDEEAGKPVDNRALESNIKREAEHLPIVSDMVCNAKPRVNHDAGDCRAIKHVPGSDSRNADPIFFRR